MPAELPKPWPPLILASASPRRHELLNQVALPHTVVPAHIDETRRPGEPPEAYVLRLASEKAQAIAHQHRNALVLAADTTVALSGDILNKPAGLTEAAAMLRSLAGHTHYVYTGIAVTLGGHLEAHVETTAVTMTAIPPGELEAYLATGDSLDKAGAYGIQGYAARWVSRIEGDYSNVVGLPLAATLRLLRTVAAFPQAG